MRYLVLLVLLSGCVAAHPVERRDVTVTLDGAMTRSAATSMCEVCE